MQPAACDAPAAGTGQPLYCLNQARITGRRGALDRLRFQIRGAAPGCLLIVAGSARGRPQCQHAGQAATGARITVIPMLPVRPGTRRRRSTHAGSVTRSNLSWLC